MNSARNTTSASDIAFAMTAGGALNELERRDVIEMQMRVRELEATSKLPGGICWCGVIATPSRYATLAKPGCWPGAHRRA